MFLLPILAGLLLGLLAAYFITRRVYQAGRACGYLEGRLFLTRRRVLMRTHVWVDGQPVDKACCVWIETNAFTADERRSNSVLETEAIFADNRQEGFQNERSIYPA